MLKYERGHNMTQKIAHLNLVTTNQGADTDMTELKKLNLVKYAGDFWTTLADYTITRDTEGYSDSASVKSAVRTFVVKSNPDKYLAFRGEIQLKNIINENKNNPFFNADDFQGTRTALIHWTMLDALNDRFNVAKEWKTAFDTFMDEAEDYILHSTDVKADETPEQTDSVSARSSVVRQLRQELSKIDKDMERMKNNREKLLAAINAIESLEVESV